MKKQQIIRWFLVISSLAALPVLAKAQSLLDSGDSSGAVASTKQTKPGLTYKRPTQVTKVRNYLFDAFGPYPIVGAAFAAGFDQARNAPPDWKQGAERYGKRFGSDFGIAAVGTTTRYALSEAFKEDALYYRCECKGRVAAAEPCRNFDLDCTPRRRRPPRLLFPCARRTVCGHDDGRLRLVSPPQRRQ